MKIRKYVVCYSKKVNATKRRKLDHIIHPHAPGSLQLATALPPRPPPPGRPLCVLSSSPSLQAFPAHFVHQHSLADKVPSVNPPLERLHTGVSRPAELTCHCWVPSPLYAGPALAILGHVRPCGVCTCLSPLLDFSFWKVETLSCHHSPTGPYTGYTH